MSIETYDPGQIVVTLNGIEVGGLADTFVKASRKTKTWTDDVSADGRPIRIKSRDKRGEVVITLKQTSATNDQFSALQQKDERDGTGVGVLQIKDLGGNTLLHADEAWIDGPPDVEFGKDLGDREWTVSCGSLDMKVGGSK